MDNILYTRITMIIIYFITIFFLTAAPCWYFKKNLRNFIFYLKLRGALRWNNRTIKRLAVAAVVICNTIICIALAFIAANLGAGIYWLYTSLPRDIPPKVYTLDRGEYLYLEKKACNRMCNFRQDTDENYCGKMIYLLPGTTVTQTAFIHPLSSNVYCRKVKTVDGIEGWM